MRALLMALAFVALTSGNALSSVLCDERSEVIAKLKENYSEVPVHIGLGNQQTVIEILVAPSGSFTIIYTYPSGLSCILAAGTAWETAKNGAPGEPT